MLETSPKDKPWNRQRAADAMRALVVCVLLFFVTDGAFAHRRGAAQSAPADAIVIPNLAHGQMAVLYANRSAILDLAGRMPRTDSTLRRLVAFINLQFSGCLWGLMPGSVTDEDSPFNECTHAYLAATRALLVHMQGMVENRDAVDALAAKTQREMAASRTSLALCRYSDEPFNTSERISPRWSEIFLHAPTLVALIGSGLMGFAAVWTLLIWTRRPEKACGSGRMSPA